MQIVVINISIRFLKKTTSLNEHNIKYVLNYNKLPTISQKK